MTKEELHPIGTHVRVKNNYPRYRYDSGKVREITNYIEYFNGWGYQLNNDKQCIYINSDFQQILKP